MGSFRNSYTDTMGRSIVQESGTSYPGGATNQLGISLNLLENHERTMIVNPLTKREAYPSKARSDGYLTSKNGDVRKKRGIEVRIHGSN